MAAQRRKQADEEITGKARARKLARVMPTQAYERRLWAAGRRAVAGIDEAGRGALAGPVVAATVMLPVECDHAGVWAEVCDSKLIAPGVRAKLAEVIKAEALAWGVGVITPQVIDAVGIAEATRQAMVAALDQLQPAADYLLIDWVRLPRIPTPQESLVKADQKIVSVAAASILAKVTRDTILVEFENTYPGYGFAAHKGYGTQLHRNAIAAQGPCAIHRHSFAPIAQRSTLSDQGDGR